MPRQYVSFREDTLEPGHQGQLCRGFNQRHFYVVPKGRFKRTKKRANLEGEPSKWHLYEYYMVYKDMVTRFILGVYDVYIYIIYMSNGLNLSHPRKDMAETVIVFCVPHRS